MSEELEVKEEVVQVGFKDFIGSQELKDYENTLKGKWKEEILASETPKIRDAYKKVGQAIEEGSYTYSTQVSHTHEGSIGNLCTSQIASQMKLVMDKMELSKIENAIHQLLT